MIDLPSLISRASTRLRNLPELRRFHTLVITSGLVRIPFFSGKLISKYSDLGDPSSSLSVFTSSSPSAAHNVFLWNSLIRAHTHNSLFSQSLHLYAQMQCAGLVPDAFTFPSVLAACAGLGDAEAGRKAHRHISEMGFGDDLYIANSLIGMYARLGSLEDAREVFDEMPIRDIVSWNSLISGFSANGKWEEAVGIYNGLRMSGVRPDCYTVKSILPAYGGLGTAGEGQAIHGLVYKIGAEKDVLVNNGLIGMYSKFGFLDYARRIFDTMTTRDAVSWNTMMDGCYQMNAFRMAVDLFREIVVRSKADVVAVTIILHVCYDTDDQHTGRSVHGYILRNGYRCDVAVLNILISLYSKFGNMDVSRKVFDRMSCRDAVSWNSIINGYINCGCFDEGAKLLKAMRESDVKPDHVTITTLISMSTQLVDGRQGMGVHCDALKRGFKSSLLVSNALLDMLSKWDLLDDALREFEEIDGPDLVTWNTIISGCVQNGNCRLALQLLSQMKIKRVSMDVATMLGGLPACSLLAAKKQGKEIHSSIFKLGLEGDLPIGNALIDLYSRCGSLDYAVHVFGRMKNRDIVTWTALVSAYGTNGQGEEALRAFRKMEEEGIAPDQVALLAVMYACSHAGLVEEGKSYFERIGKEYMLVPMVEHYACMVDLLARSGGLVEAEMLIETMPMEPDATIWGALLSACQISGDLKIAERVARRIMTLNSENIGYSILASNVYASVGKWDIVDKIRRSLRAKRSKKVPGYSWI